MCCFPGKLTIYLGRRDFVDHVSETDPVDGVLLIDRDYLAGRQVSNHVYIYTYIYWTFPEKSKKRVSGSGFFFL